MKILLIFIILVLIVLFVSGYYFFKFACVHDKSKHSEQSDDGGSPWRNFKEEHTSNVEYVHGLKKEDCWITSFDGLKLHAYFIKSNNPKRIVLCAHGYKGNGQEDFSKAIRYLHEDSDLLLIDQRACGESEGTIITFGALEKKDVIDWTLWLNNNKNNTHLPIYLYGASLGSSTVCLTSNYHFPKEVKGIIADCGYASFKDIACQLANAWFHIPGWPIVPFVDFYCRLIGHFRMKDAGASEALKNATVPVLFFHGTGDTFVIPSNTKKNYEACSSEKEVVYIDKATHVTSIYYDEKTYMNKLNEFFKKHDA